MAGAPTGPAGTAWATAYADALAKAPGGDPAQVTAGDYGPVPELATAFLPLAASGGLEGALTSVGQLLRRRPDPQPCCCSPTAPTSRTTRSRQHLGGDQWGMMNEIGNYPGQPWMWLYTFWYQVKPFSTSDNADAQVWALMMVLTLR